MRASRSSSGTPCWDEPCGLFFAAKGGNDSAGPGSDASAPAGSTQPAAASPPPPASPPSPAAPPTSPGTPPAETSAPESRPAGEPGPAAPQGKIAKLRAFLKRHGHKLWWVHSIYALSLGVGVMLLASKGFDYIRWVVAALGGTWLLFLVFFRIYRSGARRKVDGKAAKIGFVAMNYLMKDLYQIMLFFLLPFYWKSSTWGTANWFFAVGLGICAVLATLDVVFDNLVMRWRVLASLFYLIALFSCLNLVIPVVLPMLRVLWGLLAATALSAVVFLSLHFRLRSLFSRPGLVVVLVVMGVSMAGVYLGRRAIPPVPYYTLTASAGTIELPDGRVIDAQSAVPARDLERVVSVIEIASPTGSRETFLHVWRHDRKVVARLVPLTTAVKGPVTKLRLRSALPADKIPVQRAGDWTIDVETGDGQLVGRATFEVQP
jgi:hypothetical protein